MPSLSPKVKAQSHSSLCVGNRR